MCRLVVCSRACPPLLSSRSMSRPRHHVRAPQAPHPRRSARLRAFTAQTSFLSRRRRPLVCHHHSVVSRWPPECYQPSFHHLSPRLRAHAAPWATSSHWPHRSRSPPLHGIAFIHPWPCRHDTLERGSHVNWRHVVATPVGLASPSVATWRLRRDSAMRSSSKWRRGGLAALFTR